MTQHRFLPPSFISLIFLVSFIAYFIFGPAPFGDPDVPWHLESGAWILSHGQLPLHDPWSFTAGDARWWNISWLWDIALSLLFRYTGAKGLYILATGTGALTLAIVAYALRLRAVSNDSILRCCAILWFVLYMGLLPQPQLATFLFAVIFHVLLHLRRHLWALPALMLFWVNLHGGFFVGFTLLGAYMVESYTAKRSGELRRLIGISALSAAVCFINPYGIHVIDGIMASVTGFITPYISEWTPFTFGNEIAFSLLLVNFIIVSNIRAPNIALADKILAMVWLLLGLSCKRNFFLFAILGAPYFAQCMQSFLQTMRFASRKPEWNPEACRLPLAAGCVAVYIAAACIPLPPLTEKLTADPLDIGGALAAMRAQPGSPRFLNDYNIGGQLIFQSHGNWPLFIDGRAGTAYPQSLIEDYVTFIHADDDADAILDKYRIDGVILSKRHPYMARITARKDRWREIFSNDRIAAYLRRK